MKYNLIDLYYDLQMNLPALTYSRGAEIRGQMSRIVDILWDRYGYDVNLSKSFK